ncbi:hypothetical protein KKF84_09955 [Myxococcota bacterium]|nr:hypothetical protein [Myxococcota bacterium]
MDSLKCISALLLGTAIGCVNAAKKSDDHSSKTPAATAPDTAPATNPSVTSMEPPMLPPMEPPSPMDTKAATPVAMHPTTPPALPMEAMKKPAPMRKKTMRKNAMPIRVPLYE